MCSNDSMCDRLKTNDGSWKKPKPEIIAILKDKDIQKQIQTASKRYGVDPTAVAGSILAENSLNVGVKDSVQTWLAKKAGITSIAGKNFSYGLGQIQFPTARAAEDYVAKLEHREPKSDEDLSNAVADPVGSIEVAASIVRKVQDDYKAQGIDISKKPAILASLYNLGQSEERAAAAKKSGRVPQENYFGLFVEKYTPEIQEAAGLSGAAIAATAASSSAPATSKSLAKTVSSGLNRKYTVTSSVPLVSAPKTCGESAYMGDNVAASSYGAPVGVLEKDSTYKELSRTLDCDTQVWKMVQSGDTVGWIKEEQLNKVSTTKLVQSVRCEADPAATECQKNIEKVSKDNLLKNDKKDGLVYLKPVTAGKNITPDFNNEDGVCKSEAELNGQKDRMMKQSQRLNRIGGFGFSQSSSNSNSNMPQPITLTKAELVSRATKIQESANQELAKMSKATGIPVANLSDGSNPYNMIAKNLESVKQSASSCLNVKTNEAGYCDPIGSLSDGVKNWAGQVKYKKMPTIDEVYQANSKFLYRNSNGNVFYARTGENMSYYTPTEQELASLSVDDIREGLKSCEDRYKKVEKKVEEQNAAQMAKAQAVWQEQMQAIAKKNGGKSPYGNMLAGYGMYGQVVSGQAKGKVVTGGTPCPNCAGGNYIIGPGNTVTVYPSNGYIGGGAYGGAYSGRSEMTETFKALDKATSDQVKKFNKEIVTFSKMCNARLNLIEKSNSKNSISCAQAPTIIKTGGADFPRDMVKAMYKDNPSSLTSEIADFGDEQLNNVMRELKPRKQAMTAAAMQAQMDDWDDMNANRKSYCPNKTADYIEDLMKNNPCITHVYVPTNFLNKKLEGSGKVIFRKFDKSDRFAVEFGDPICK